MAKEYILHMHQAVNRKMRRYAWDTRRELGKWNLREIARRRLINIKYVSNYLTKGIEPSDTTPEGQAARAALFLKPIKPKPRKHREPEPEEWTGQNRRKAAIKRMKTQTANVVVRHKPNDWTPPPPRRKSDEEEDPAHSKDQAQPDQEADQDRCQLDRT